MESSRQNCGVSPASAGIESAEMEGLKHQECKFYTRWFPEELYSLREIVREPHAFW